MIEHKIGKMPMHLFCNGMAAVQLADIEREDEKNRNIIELIGEHSVDGLERLSRVVQILARQGELMRRREGYEKNEFPDAEWIVLNAKPLDILRLREAAIKAIIEGYSSETSNEDEEDPYLNEYQKKTESH